ALMWEPYKSTGTGFHAGKDCSEAISRNSMFRFLHTTRARAGPVGRLTSSKHRTGTVADSLRRDVSDTVRACKQAFQKIHAPSRHHVIDGTAFGPACRAPAMLESKFC